MKRGSPKNRLLDYWLGIPVLNAFTAFSRKSRPWPERVRKVGVLCSPALGDTLLFGAALQDLRAHLDRGTADAGEAPIEIVHLCMNSNLAAAELILGADRRLVISLTDPRGSIRLIRAESFDVLLDFSAWQRLTAFLSLMSRAHHTVGFRSIKQYRSRGYDVAVEHRSDRHEVDNFRALIAAIGVEPAAEPQVVIPPIASEPLAGEQDLVVFHLWASGQRSHLREWPEERWLALAAHIAGPDTLFILTGAPSDQVRSEAMLQRMRAAGLRAQGFSGIDGFVTLAHLLRRARVVVSVNTGVMHLAAILGAPTVSINGPNRNGRWGPQGPRALGVEAPGEGCGYLHLGFEFDGRAEDCMQRISVEMVAEAVASMSNAASFAPTLAEAR